MRPAFMSHPRPEGYVEGTYMTPEQMRAWVLSMPEDLQLEYFEQVSERLSVAHVCFTMDHVGRISDLEHRINTLAEEKHGIER